MPFIEKARQDAEPIPNLSFQDSPEAKASPVRLQVFLLARRCALSAWTAEAPAPLIYGSVRS
jgi:hypothetical protein